MTTLNSHSRSTLLLPMDWVNGKRLRPPAICYLGIGEREQDDHHMSVYDCSTLKYSESPFARLPNSTLGLRDEKPSLVAYIDFRPE